MDCQRRILNWKNYFHPSSAFMSLNLSDSTEFVIYLFFSSNQSRWSTLLSTSSHSFQLSSPTLPLICTIPVAQWTEQKRNQLFTVPVAVCFVVMRKYTQEREESKSGPAGAATYCVLWCFGRGIVFLDWCFMSARMTHAYFWRRRRHGYHRRRRFWYSV